MAPKKSAFYYFMHSLKNEEKRFKTTKEFIDHVGSRWDSMNSDEKKKYQDMAKSVTKAKKEYATSFVNAFLKEEERIKEEEHIMNATIHKMVNELDDNDLGNKKFYLCHVNYYYRIGTYCLPAELALLEFTLNKGITKKLHFIVKGAIIPLGYRLTAEEWAERTHRIPLQWCTEPSNHAEILKNIVELLDPEKTGCFPPIFSMPDNEHLNFSIRAIKSIFADLSKLANAPPDIFRIFSLPRLFNEIVFKAAAKMDGVTLPCFSAYATEIIRDRFITFNNSACEYHTQSDLIYHCSLSLISRWAYTIISHYSKIIGSFLILGKDDKEKQAWVALRSKNHSLLYRATAPIETIAKSDVKPTLINYGTQRMEREAERIKEEELAAQNSEVRLPNVHTLNAHLSNNHVSKPNEVPDIGGVRISRNETPAPFWPKELFRNKKMM